METTTEEEREKLIEGCRHVLGAAAIAKRVVAELGGLERIIHDLRKAEYESTRFLEQLLVRAGDALESRDALRDLLAVIHGDGGHHQVAVGTKQATADAMELVHRLKEET